MKKMDEEKECED